VTGSDPTVTPNPETVFEVVEGWAPADDDVFEAEGQVDVRAGVARQALEWGAVIVGALIAALLLKTFLFQAFFIPSASMEPTLMVGDRVLVNKVSYDFGDIQRGDVIVFARPENAPESIYDDFIKRVVGLPGDTLQGIDGRVYVNGVELDESYLPEGTRTDNLPQIVVPPDHLFVMGDNRGNSTDSRFFGPINRDLVVGKAFLIVWPPSDAGGL